jgi:pSer/pThr/pTyr-binding forkhead associated (FHA) protein
VLSGAKTGTRFVLKQETTIGRSNGDLALEDPTVSGEHAKIQFENSRYRLLNRSLTNPTMVNGNRIEGLVDLKDGDELVMGGTKMRFTLVK